MNIGSYTLFDKVIDLTCYKHTRVVDARKGTWEADGDIIQSSEYTSPDGKVYKKVIDSYKKDIVISCDKSGMKPDISLSFKAVPGRNVTQCEIRITNLQLDSLRVKEWALVEITAGYRSADASYGKTRLAVDIFSAWTETPNPDGVTVIQGIATGGALGMFFGPRKFFIQFNTEYVTIRDLVSRLLNQKDVISFPTFHEDIEVPFLDKKIGSVTNPDTGKIEYIAGTIGDLKIQVQNIRLSADTGYQIVQWIGRELYEWGRKYGWFIITNIFNDRIKISCMNDDESSGENTVILRVIDSAAFTGGTLTVKAPWTPSLIPGGLFKLNPKYFSLQNTYRGVDTSIYRDEENVYRCITMDVSFDTNGDNNQMSLFAIPFRVAQNPWDTYTDASVNFLDKEKDSTLNLEQWTQKKQTGSLMTTILFGPSEVQAKGKPSQDSLWSKIDNEGITGINSKTVTMNSFVNKESFTAVNWYQIFRESVLPKGRGEITTLDPIKTEVVYPVLTRSECRKILDAIKRDNTEISSSIKNQLRTAKSFSLIPDSLWILYPLYAYYMSGDTGGKLAEIMSKDTLGALLDSSYNSTSSSTIIPADSEKTDTISLPDIKAITTFKDAKDGGNRSDWGQFSNFKNTMNIVIQDKTMKANTANFNWDMFVIWYYYFEEVV